MPTYNVFAVVILLSIPSLSDAQVVTFNYQRWKNSDIQKMIDNTKANLVVLLNRTGFQSTDSIAVNFNWSLQYMQVTHNLTDRSEIQMLYNNIVVHTPIMKATIRHTRITDFRIYVRLEKDLYLFTEYAEPSLRPERVKIQDKYFK